MLVREVAQNEKLEYNKHVSHVVQSWEWGEFRKSTGLELVRLGHFEGNKLVNAYQVTLHPVPLFSQKIGYLPKGPIPDKEMVKALRDMALRRNVAFIKIEPNVIIGQKQATYSLQLEKLGLYPSKKSLFTKHNFLIDLTKSEDGLLSAMHPKTRYNIGIAKRYGVQVSESTRDADFEIYLKLYFETVKRQKYFGHTPDYHRLAWKTLMPAKMSRLLIAKYMGKPLVAWMLFNFGDALYYPYGGSSIENREVMASNLVCWEAIRLGKKMGLKIFDMWGALAPETKENNEWYGFHRFKAGFGGTLVEYIGTYDLIFRQALYRSLNIADKLRWVYLRARNR